MNPVSSISSAGPLSQAMSTAASGLHAQATRLRLVAENLANADSTAAVPGGSPYQRKVMSFDQAVDKVTGAATVMPGPVTTDPTAFPTMYDPSHPAADANGYVSMPNVSSDIETADMRESERSYEANLQVLAQARTMYGKTLDILKG